MNGPEKNASSPAAAPTLESPDARGEVIRYFRIDFHRCLIRRGTRAKPAEENHPPLIKAR